MRIKVLGPRLRGDDELISGSLNAAVNKKPWPDFPPGFFYA